MSWKCLGCGFHTGQPEAANGHRCGSSGRWERCTCGSGGHPRRCELHPGAYEAHLAELNEEADAPEAALGERDWASELVEFKFLQGVLSALADVFQYGGKQRWAFNVDRLPKEKRGDVKLVLEALRAQVRTWVHVEPIPTDGFVTWADVRRAYTKVPDRLFAEFCAELDLKPEPSE